MKIAYLIDKDAVGGGCEYIRRQMAAHPDDEAKVFFSDRGECTAAKMNAWGADVIHVNHLKALLQLFRNPLSKPRGKVVFTVHGIHLRKYDFLPKTLQNRAKRLCRLMLERSLYGKCDKIIALTETDATDIRRLYGRNLPTVVEPNQIDAGSLRPAAGLRYGQDEFAFVCIARFDFQKGQDVLIEAIAHAQDGLRSSGAKTLFIGGGNRFGEMEKLAGDRGVRDLVEFAGEIPDAGVYMTCGRFLVAPSRWEGMPYLLLEALARGRRIIASDCPGNRDVLKNSANAAMFPVCESHALSRLMLNAFQSGEKP